MIDNTRTRLSDEVVEPSLLDIISDRELKEIIQKCSSSGKVEIEIKVSQNGQQLLIAEKIKFDQCPCNPPQHRSACFHSVDAAGNAICS